MQTKKGANNHCRLAIQVPLFHLRTCLLNIFLMLIVVCQMASVNTQRKSIHWCVLLPAHGSDVLWPLDACNRLSVKQMGYLWGGRRIQSLPLRPREIVESAITRGAVAMVFVHNHPSGDPAPSKSDKQLTRDLVYAGSIMRIRVLDHIIIGGDSYFSFADEGLINKYELGFLNLKIRRVSDNGAGYSKDSLASR